MVFDRLGRRVDYQEMRDDQVATHFRFVYDNFLCVQRLNTANGNAVRTEFVWDPTEPIATRPLVMRAKNWDLNLFYTHDGNKNVSEVFYHALQNGIAAHYDYAPFGAVSRTSRATRVTNRDPLPILLGIPRCSFGTYLLQLSSLSFFLWALDTAR